jgi:hypothetical protein
MQGVGEGGGVPSSEPQKVYASDVEKPHSRRIDSCL